MNFEKKISEIEKKIGYTFKDKQLLKQAFTRSSFCNEQSSRDDYQSNEVLEFFGDGVLSCAIITVLLKEHSTRYEHGIKTKLKEGDFSNIKSRLSDKKNLSEATAALGLEKYLLLGEGDLKLGIEKEPSVMEDLFESIIGAIYIDSGLDMNAVLSSVLKMLDIKKYYEKTQTPIQSFKNALQEWCADKNHRCPPPVYKTLSETGPDHKKLFERGCYIGEELVGIGKGKNQRIADALAAEAALEALRKKSAMACQKNKNPELVMQRLRQLAKDNKSPSPEFRDLGETPSSTEKIPEFCIECRLLGECAAGIGSSKREARESASAKLLTILEKKRKASKSKNTAKKSTGKSATPIKNKKTI